MRSGLRKKSHSGRAAGIGDKDRGRIYNLNMDADFLDRESEQLKRGHESNMPYRRQIEIVLGRVKERFVEGRRSEEAALKDLRDSVRDSPQCKKHQSVKKTVSQSRKSGTKLTHKK